MKQRADYTVIILTWNSRQHVRACLESLRDAAPGYRGDVIVIDNGSTDGTPDIVRELVPDARLVQNQVNRGVAAARNQGLALARSPVSIILDVDTVVQPGAFARLLSFLEATPSVGVCGPRLVLPDDTIQASCQSAPGQRSEAVHGRRARTSMRRAVKARRAGSAASQSSHEIAESSS